ncbi:MAG: hypothetical protein ACRDWA_09210 [Acidimicrobiia bacterium]
MLTLIPREAAQQVLEQEGGSAPSGLRRVAVNVVQLTGALARVKLVPLADFSWALA